MDYVRNLQDRIPAVDRLSLLALVVMIVVGAADVFFVTRFIVPRWNERRDLQTQLVAALEELDTARRAQQSNPDELQKQVDAAQAKLDNVASIFLSDSQASEALNKLYRYAIESQVEITDLQTKPPLSEEDKKDTYDVREFGLQASGAFRNLANFVSQIEEASLESFVISNVNITGEEERRILDMDVALYTSPYSPGAMVSPTPVATVAPEDLTQLELTLVTAWASEDWEQAIDLVERILAIDPDYADMTEKLYAAYVNYGRQLLDEGDPDEATTQFNSALEINPDGVEAQTGREQAASWVPTPTPAVVPTSTPPRTLTVEEQLEQRLHESWAIASDDDKRAEEWEEVIGLIGQILAVNPGDEDMTEKLYAAYVNYGRELVEEGKLDEAKIEFTRALDVNPGGEEAMWELATLSAGATPVPPATSVPTATPTPQPQQDIIHVVKSGENLYRISLQYGTTVDAIMKANGLTSTNIYVGQQLLIPAQ